jgi:redox-sensing transcriptional repressor
VPGLSGKIIGRLVRYRRSLHAFPSAGRTHIYSHEIAETLVIADSQVRRDLRTLGTRGTPSRGYEILGLLRDLDRILKPAAAHAVAVVGAGRLGRALMATLHSSPTDMRISCAFDVNPVKCDRIHAGIKCHRVEALEQVVAQERITIAILCVPAAAAQGVAERLVRAGVRGILDFSSAPLSLPKTIALDEIDINIKLAKLAYLSLHPPEDRRNGRRA